MEDSQLCEEPELLGLKQEQLTVKLEPDLLIKQEPGGGFRGQEAGGLYRSQEPGGQYTFPTHHSILKQPTIVIR